MMIGKELFRGFNGHISSCLIYSRDMAFLNADFACYFLNCPLGKLLN